ncbi:jg1839 [Pararge aegeria aegeria]|uniref:Jg1839 protein n=1 Tax=Pararge aegeria aegeria TaxID=348720 RepID=A0A8S4QZJ4_9NEOP|nr:jg1839 [Pararge aegeria aegeria]
MPYKPKFCTECAQRLTNCNKFREKSLRAYNLLSILVGNHDLVTSDCRSFPLFPARFNLQAGIPLWPIVRQACCISGMPWLRHGNWMYKYI